MIYGIGIPSKLRPAGTLYTDRRTGTIYVQNASPSGNAWSILDNNIADDAIGGPGSVFTGGTVVGATNFLSTISSGGTNISSIFAFKSHNHAISDVSGLQAELDGKAGLDSPQIIGNPTIGIGEGGTLEVAGNITGNTIYAVSQLITSGIRVNVIDITEATAYDVLTSDCTFYITNTSTIRLPGNPGNGRILYFKMSSTGGKTLTIEGNGKNIDGSSSRTMSTARESLTLIFNSSSSEWMVI